jgi:amino acid adenylation domain-containing protein
MSTAAWREALAGAPFTALPRWRSATGPAGGTAIVEVDVEVAWPVAPAVLLAAHGKVLAALTGEREVVTGYRSAAGAEPLPCRMPVPDGTWASLVDVAAQALDRVRAVRPVPLAVLREELGGGDPLFETVLDVSGRPLYDAGDIVLTVALRPSGGRATVQLRYRRDAFDAEYATRLGGYYAQALRALGADRSARHQGHALLSAAELRHQLHGLAGRRGALPDRSFAELFAERVAARPDAVAVQHQDRTWTYDDVHRRAQRIASSLRARGLASEDVVAVATERSVDWIAVIVGVLMAGGAYLPIDPGVPADRTAKVLRRSGCRFVLSQPGVAGQVASALDESRWPDAKPPREWSLDTALAEGDERPAGVTARADQLAYIYFTSGSTGEPKGAMCEHGGMLNHLYAKIEDFGIGDGDVVVQNAPQSFDISLWQVLVPLLAGGRILLVDRTAILDPARFVAEIVAGGATVLQVVPSYLEVLLTYLDAEPRGLGRLRRVSVTGEAITKELVERWFARYDIPLVNAYGATEASDDTTHAVLRGVPAEDLVPLGKPIRNVRVYVLDEHLSMVPLGAPGEIAFSGVCVGRGYVNDEQQSRLAFVADPYEPGQRLYRTGDFGRWLPSGELEFLGRRDEQVKIRGFRIEISEIEDRLTRMPGVRTAAVVVEDVPDRGKNLVGFYCAEAAVSAAALRDFAAAALPGYMVPTYLHRLPQLPLTANGKVDKGALAALAGTLGHGGASHAAPRTPTERRVAAAWAEVLGVPLERIGRADHFFDRGGSSLSAVRLIVKLDRAVSLADLAGSPVLSDLAAVIDGQLAHSNDSLHLLSAPAAAPAGAVVCFPYAGGNAVNFQPLARALAGTGVAVYGIELPGHDLHRQRSTLRGVEEVAASVVVGIGRRVEAPVVLLGYGEGAAPALATARLLAGRGADLRGVVVAAQPLPDRAALRALIDVTSAMPDAEIKARLTADATYVELDGARQERSDVVTAAYRHDVVHAAGYFLDARRGEVRLPVPLTVVTAADDLATAPPAGDHRRWEVFAARVEAVGVAGGGHYFLRTRAADLARVVLDAVEPPASTVDGQGGRYAHAA